MYGMCTAGFLTGYMCGQMKQTNMIFLFVSRENCHLQITGKSEWGKVSTWPGSKQTTQEVGTVEVLAT